jgi:hypothetical protein
MCDRVADLAHRLPRTDRTADLPEQMVRLSQRIADDGPSPLQSRLPWDGSARRPSAEQLRPCEICASMSSALWEFLRRFQYEIIVSPKAQQNLAGRGGLCSFHTWQYESAASFQGICEGYAAVLEGWAAWMHAAVAEAQTDRVATKLKARLPGEQGCVMCEVCAKTESEAIAALTCQLVDNETQTFDKLSALCLPHIAELAAAIKSARVVRELMRRQACLLDRLAEDMKRYALKRDAVRSALLSDEEETASKRGLSLLARARNVAVVKTPSEPNPVSVKAAQLHGGPRARPGRRRRQAFAGEHWRSRERQDGSECRRTRHELPRPRRNKRGKPRPFRDGCRSRRQGQLDSWPERRYQRLPCYCDHRQHFRSPPWVCNRRL